MLAVLNTSVLNLQKTNNFICHLFYKEDICNVKSEISLRHNCHDVDTFINTFSSVIQKIFLYCIIVIFISHQAEFKQIITKTTHTK